MGCGCKQPIIRNPKPTPEVIKTTNNGESETTITGTTNNQ